MVTRQVIIPLAEYEHLQRILGEAAKLVADAVRPSVSNPDELRLPNYLSDLRRAINDYRAVVGA